MGTFGFVAILLCLIAVYISVSVSNQVKDIDLARRPLLDKKSKLVSDSILSIKNIKFNAWEHLRKEKIGGIRKEDSQLLLTNFTLQGVSTALIAMIPSIVGLCCLGYVRMVLGKNIRVETVYIILLLLNNLKRTMIFINLAFVELNSCFISFKRLRLFLSIEDYQKAENHEEDLETYEMGEDDLDQGSVVDFTHCSLRWRNEEYRRRMGELVESTEKNEAHVEEFAGEESEEKRRELVEREATLKGINLQVKGGMFALPPSLGGWVQGRALF